MKSLITFITLTFVAIASANADVGQFYDTARVVNINVIPGQQQTIQDCSNAGNYQQQNQRNNTGGLIGGIAGALLGSQVGGGNGRIAAAAAGALVGGLTGDRMDNNQQNQGSNNGCTNRVVNTQNEYIVTFDYNGRQGTLRTNQIPGTTVRVLVSVTAMQ